MANRTPAPFVHVDAATAENARRQGRDPHKLEQSSKFALCFLDASLPDPPVNANALLSALPGPDTSGDDRISALPFALLRNIVSRLPAKDAVRTAVFSRRWRPVWRCSPLVFADIHLLPRRHHPTRADTPGLVAAISRVLATHPGPFRSVHLVCGYLDAHRLQLARWVQRLADKGVQELVLVNRPFPLDVPLPAALFDIGTLTRLYLGIWKFPDTSALARGLAVPFPNLRELVLCTIDMESRDLDYLLASSPVLETLGILGSKKGVRLRLTSQHLRCVQISFCQVEGIHVVDCPNLERLFLWGFMDEGACGIRFKIGHAPKLHQLGFLEPGVHMLEIGNTVINPLTNSGIKASPSSMAYGVKILGVHSAESTEVTGKVNLKFWEEAGPIKCIQGIKSMSFREFQGKRSEVSFLKFFFQNAKALKNAVVMVSKGRFTSIGKFCFLLKKVNAV
ncbi:hypothetical protein QOZ80_4AG0326130 [Eleusine coracana subsp. coracana]|nr:hypothetical protein QOZ80_4AG0326130 [Eleusine coracana subsp. coracana]